MINSSVETNWSENYIDHPIALDGERRKRESNKWPIRIEYPLLNDWHQLLGVFFYCWRVIIFVFFFVLFLCFCMRRATFGRDKKNGILILSTVMCADLIHWLFYFSVEESSSSNSNTQKSRRLWSASSNGSKQMFIPCICSFFIEIAVYYSFISL